MSATMPGHAGSIRLWEYSGSCPVTYCWLKSKLSTQSAVVSKSVACKVLKGRFKSEMVAYLIREGVPVPKRNTPPSFL